MPINTYRARCRFCGQSVPKRKGRVDKSKDGLWLVSHLKCYDKAGPPTQETPDAPPPRRLPYADDN